MTLRLTDEPRGSDATDPTVTKIAPPQFGDIWHDLKILPKYLPLFRTLIWRFVIVRYLQSVLGVLWALLQPVATTLVLLFMFNIIRINTSDGGNAGLFLLVGVVVWQFFARAVQDATGSLVANSGILTKIYLPKIMLPSAAVVAAWFDLAIIMSFVLIAFLALGVPLSERLLLLPVFLVLISLAALALGIGLSAINALYRDVGFALPFALQIGFYVTPVLYSTRFIAPAWRPLYYLNPMASLVEGVRWTLLPASPSPDPFYLALDIGLIVAVLVSSVLLFQQLDSEIVDRI
jgi:lipopolysaccharide transport system permease protein